jgi:hypothetical protein
MTLKLGRPWVRAALLPTPIQNNCWVLWTLLFCFLCSREEEACICCKESWQLVFWSEVVDSDLRLSIFAVSKEKQKITRTRRWWEDHYCKVVEVGRKLSDQIRSVSKFLLELIFTLDHLQKKKKMMMMMMMMTLIWEIMQKMVLCSASSDGGFFQTVLLRACCSNSWSSSEQEEEENKEEDTGIQSQVHIHTLKSVWDFSRFCRICSLRTRKKERKKER